MDREVACCIVRCFVRDMQKSEHDIWEKSTSEGHDAFFVGTDDPLTGCAEHVVRKAR